MQAQLQKIDRRALLALIPATALLWGCPKKASLNDEQWRQSGDAQQSVDHSQWDAMLTTYVKETADGINLVDYAQFKKTDAATLKQYIALLQTIKIEQYSKAEQFAFWVNLYNAVTIDLVLDAYPVKSIRDIGSLGLGPWGKKVVTVSGKTLSLDDIEHGILRPVWKDVRIHYAVNCASIGCPNLANKAYTADRLEVMLEAAAKSYINHPRGFIRKNGKLVASSIFIWYGSDWGNEQALLDHARKYASPETLKVIGSAAKIDSHDYNWSLNDVGS